MTNEPSVPPGAPNELPPPGLPVAKVDYLYRVYCVREPMPPLEKLLKRLTAGNPHNPPGGFVFPPGKGMRRLQDALGASKDYFVMGYGRDEAPDLWKELEAALPEQGKVLDEQDRLIVRDSALCVVLRAEIENPENNEFVETLVHLADAFRDLLLGIVWDVRMGKIFGHNEWRERTMEEPFSVLNHVSVRAVPGPAGGNGSTKRLRTFGLRKFGSPDLMIDAIPPELVPEAANLLRDFSEHLTQGDLLGPDEVIEYTGGRVRAVPAPPLAEGENDLLVLVDDVEGAEKIDPASGAAKTLAAAKAAREEVEGKRAEGGKGAQ